MDRKELSRRSSKGFGGQQVEHEPGSVTLGQYSTCWAILALRSWKVITTLGSALVRPHLKHCFGFLSQINTLTR